MEEDNLGNVEKALELYTKCLEYFSTHLKYEKNPKVKDAITAKVRACGTAGVVAWMSQGQRLAGRHLATGVLLLMMRRRHTPHGIPC